MKTLMELVGTKPLEWQLENLQNAKYSWSPKKLACANSARMNDWIVWYRNFVFLLNTLLDVSRVLN
jgi:hypothetical protein